MNWNQSPPLVSIIITTYNGSAFIDETIQSVVDQTYGNWELIIVDDGSSDDTVSKVRAWADERIQVFCCHRCGVNGVLKNFACSKTTGRLIAFIDQDDLWHATKLEKQVAALVNDPASQFSLTGGYHFRKMDKPERFFYQQREGILRGNVFAGLFRSEVAAWLQSLLVWRDALIAVGLFRETGRFSDSELIFRLAHEYTAVLLYEPLFFRRLHPESYSTVHWIASHREGLETICEYGRRRWLSQQQVRDVLFRSHVHFGEKCILYRESRRAIHSFWKAWRERPFSWVPLKKTVKAMFYSISFSGAGAQ